MGVLTLRKSKDYIADDLAREIMTGRIPDGEELVQEELAERTGLSRMPVREALQTLVHMGMARRLPNRHVVAVGPTERAIRCTFDMLSAMEAEFVRQILGQGIDLSDWRERARRFVREPSGEGEMALHTTLSDALAVYSIIDAHRQLLDGYFSYALRYCLPERGASVGPVEKFRRAMADADETAAVAVLKEYFAAVARYLIESGKYE